MAGQIRRGNQQSGNETTTSKSTNRKLGMMFIEFGPGTPPLIMLVGRQ
jgi:hypothetical protein